MSLRTKRCGRTNGRGRFCTFIRLVGWCVLLVILLSGAAIAQDMPKETVTVGIRDDFLPFSDMQAINGEEIYTGYDVEIIRAVARDMDVDLVFTTAPPVTLIPMTAEGLVDLAPGMAHRRGWELAVDFSETYFLSGARILVTRRSGITRLTHLKHKPIAVIDDSMVGGFTPDDVIAVLPEADVTIADDLPAAMELLESREVVGVVADLRTLMGELYADEEKGRYRIVTEPITTTPVGIMLPPNNDRLRERVNFALMDIFETGVYQNITETWLIGPFPDAVGLEFVMELWPE